MSKIAVIIGSTRQGRQSDRLATWAAQEIKNRAEVEILDLRDYPMSFLDEAISPRYNPERTPDTETKKWLDKLVEFDGFVFITPEYNRSTSAVLKNAIDVIGHETDNKPAAIIAHGSSGGAQAAANLRVALPGVGFVTIPEALYFSDRVAESINDEGELSEEIRANPYGPQTQLTAQVDSLLWYTDALKGARP